jgi:transcriptional regulator of NAD metabolism
MRTFRYNFDGLEVFIDVISEEGETIANGRFPTPAGAKEYYRKDLDYLLSQKNLPVLTDEEASVCFALIID